MEDGSKNVGHPEDADEFLAPGHQQGLVVTEHQKVNRHIEGGLLVDKLSFGGFVHVFVNLLLPRFFAQLFARFIKKMVIFDHRLDEVLAEPEVGDSRGFRLHVLISGFQRT